jgi:hypothetical protein
LKLEDHKKEKDVDADKEFYQNRAPAKHKLEVEWVEKFSQKNFWRKVSEQKKQKKNEKLHRQKLKNERKAVCKNKNKSFHLFLRREKTLEKRLFFITFLQRKRKKLLSNFGGKLFRSRSSSIALPRTVKRLCSCLLCVACIGCRWSEKLFSFYKTKMKFYDAAFVFFFCKARDAEEE